MSVPHVEFQVEEPSMEAMLQILAPRLLAGRASFKIINYRSKHRLLRELPKRLHGYAARLQHESLRLLVLVDRDQDDCLMLKARLEEMATIAGLGTRTRQQPGGLIHVVNRIVVEELEAWFLGDPEAIRAAFPDVPSSFERRMGFRSPDAIRGGTCEALHRLLQQAGYLRGAYPKIEIARRIAPHLDPARNRSPSFGCFVKGLAMLLSPATRQAFPSGG